MLEDDPPVLNLPADSESIRTRSTQMTFQHRYSNESADKQKIIEELLWWVHTVLNRRFSVSAEGSTEASNFRRGTGHDRAKTVDIVNTKRLTCWIRIVDWSVCSQVITFIRTWSRQLEQDRNRAIAQSRRVCTRERARGLHRMELLRSAFDAPTPSWFLNSYFSPQVRASFPGSVLLRYQFDQISYHSETRIRCLQDPQLK